MLESILLHDINALHETEGRHLTMAVHKLRRAPRLLAVIAVVTTATCVRAQSERLEYDTHKIEMNTRSVGTPIPAGGAGQAALDASRNLYDLVAGTLDAQPQLLSYFNTYLLADTRDRVFESNAEACRLPGASCSSHPNDDMQTLPVPYGQNLLYSSLLDPAAFGSGQGAVNAAENYIRNASGMNVFHHPPRSSRYVRNADLRRSGRQCQSYYNTVMSAESFGAYVLRRQQGGGFSDEITADLVRKANETNRDLESEDIGIVLREMLLYQKQTFVLLTELVKAQRETLTAQVLTNSILIAANQPTESKMCLSQEDVKKALEDDPPQHLRSSRQAASQRRAGER